MKVRRTFRKRAAGVRGLNGRVDMGGAPDRLPRNAPVAASVRTPKVRDLGERIGHSS